MRPGCARTRAEGRESPQGTAADSEWVWRPLKRFVGRRCPISARVARPNQTALPRGRSAATPCAGTRNGGEQRIAARHCGRFGVGVAPSHATRQTACGVEAHSDSGWA